MKTEKEREKRLTTQEETDLQLIKKMKEAVDDGYDVELRRAKGGGYKALKVDKRILSV